MAIGHSQRSPPRAEEQSRPTFATPNGYSSLDSFKALHKTFFLIRSVFKQTRGSLPFDGLLVTFLKKFQQTFAICVVSISVQLTYWFRASYLADI